MLPAGTLFGLRQRGGRVDLFCRVEAVRGGVVEGWVINGLWRFDLHPDGRLVIHSPSGEEKSAGWTVLTHPALTRYGDYSYNEAIDFMNGPGKRHTWLHKWLWAKTLHLQSKWRRFKYACNCFRVAWVGIPPRKAGERMSDDEFYYDSISF